MIDKILDNQPPSHQKDEDKISIQDLKKSNLLLVKLLLLKPFKMPINYQS